MLRRSGLTGAVPLTVGTGANTIPKSKPIGVVKKPTRSRIRNWPTNILHTLPTGLRNGNAAYCYRRATMQCLLHLPVLYNHLGYTHVWHAGPTNRCVACSMQDMWNLYWNEPARTSFPGVAVARHDAAVWHEGPRGTTFLDSRTNNQGDALEYYEYLRYTLLNLSTKADNAKADRMLTIRHQTQWWCPTCNHQFGDQDDGMGLRLSVTHGQQNVVATMIQNDYNDILAFSCPHCPAVGQQQCTRQRRITQIPEVLVIHLNRLGWNRSMGMMVRTSAPVNYPLNSLDLSAYTANGTQLRYDLYGVVAHRGNERGGHYIASVRERGGQQFHTISDSNVNLNGVDKPLKDERGFDATILFYLKQ